MVVVASAMVKQNVKVQKTTHVALPQLLTTGLTIENALCTKH